ncbi:hypothetical protein GGR51DRAFT_564749 [Nemania sp. FL0031]|nr:hypothetical protein GGR51DRAFT_564749 [Nemania sp. FL0031]
MEDKSPIFLSDIKYPAYLKIDGGRNLQPNADPKGSIQRPQPANFETTSPELPKNIQDANKVKYRSMFSTGVTLWTLSSAVRDDKDALRESRVNKTAKLNPIRFAPCAVVKDPKLRIRLVEIASYIEYLDRGFAEYFQAAGYSDDREAVHKLLRHARQTVQRRKPSDSFYTGDLGKFCESVFAAWKRPSENREWAHYCPKIRNDEDKIEYLQDALEIPYWEFMINSFMDWRQINLNHMRRASKAASNSTPEEQEGVQVVIEGVEQRLELLDRVLLGSTISLEDLDDDIIDERPGGSCSRGLVPRASFNNTSSETSTLISLVFLFLILSTTFFTKGFAISWKEDKAGSFEDADFWYLCQSNAMFVLGSLVAAKPLLKHRSVDGTRAMFWLSFAIGFCAAIISIVIYPLFNTCYSALAAFIGSVASAWSLVALTQATSQEAHGQAAAQTARLKDKEKIR